MPGIIFLIRLITILLAQQSNPLAFLGLLFIGIVFAMFHFLSKGAIFVIGETVRMKNRLELTPAMMERFHGYLSDFTYYLKLDETNRKKFLIRLAEFMSSKDWVGAEGLVVTERMKVMVSASAAQLLFGLDRYTLDYFSIIRIYPGIFYSKLMRVHMKGGTSMGGVIMLSWKDFEEGYKVGTDKLNLGLHELAHALRIEVQNGDSYDTEFAEALVRWDEYTAPLLDKVKRGEVPFLRKYGGTNTQEFWAVCIEHFFEAPEQFSEQLPEVYNYLGRLLSQDPLTHRAAPLPAFTEIPRPVIEPVEQTVLLPPSPVRTRPYFATEILTWGCLVLMFPVTSGIYGLCQNAAITATAVVLTAAAFTLVGVFIFRKKWQRGEMNIPAYAFHSIVLCGLVGTLLMLGINYVTAAPLEPEVYGIKTYRVCYDQYQKVELSLENDAYAGYKNIRTVSYKPFGHEKKLVLNFKRGIFGIKLRNSWSYKEEP